MSTELAVLEKPEAKLAEIRFSVTETTIKETIAKFVDLKINGIDDEEGFAKVKRARLDCVKARTTIDKERLAAGAEFREQIKKVDASAKNLLSMLEPTECRLKNLEDGVEKERQKIAEQKLDVRHRIRQNKIKEAGGAHTRDSVRMWTDEAFESYLVECAEFNRQRKEREAEEAKIADANRLKQEELKKAEAALAERKRKLDEQAVEQNRIQDELAEKERLSKAIGTMTEPVMPGIPFDAVPTDEANEISRDGYIGFEIKPADRFFSGLPTSLGKAKRDPREDYERVMEFAEKVTDLKSPRLSSENQDDERAIGKAHGEFLRIVLGIADKYEDQLESRPRENQFVAG
jgi:hypothetical protein